MNRQQWHWTLARQVNERRKARNARPARPMMVVGDNGQMTPAGISKIVGPDGRSTYVYATAPDRILTENRIAIWYDW